MTYALAPEPPLNPARKGGSCCNHCDEERHEHPHTAPSHVRHPAGDRQHAHVRVEREGLTEKHEHPYAAADADIEGDGGLGRLRVD